MSLVECPMQPGRVALRSLGAVALGASLAAALAGCTTAGKIVRDNLPIVSDPTQGYGGGKDAPNRNDPYPKLGTVPARPKITETFADRRQMQNELVADRAASELFPKPPGMSGPEVAGVEPATSASTKTADAAKTTAQIAAAAPGAQTAANEPKKPGIWERFFGHKTKPAPDPNAVEPLPAQPTTPVTIKPADPAVPRS